MIPSLIFIDGNKVSFPRNVAAVFGCPGWFRSHARGDSFDVVLWSRKEPRNFMLDIFSNSRVRVLDLEWEWQDGDKEMHTIPPFAGYGFPFDENLLLPCQISNGHGFPLGFYEKPMPPKNHSFIDYALSDQFKNTNSPRALDQIIRKMSYVLSTDPRLDLSQNPPYSGDPSIANAIIVSLSKSLQSVSSKKDLTHLIKWFKTHLVAHCSKAMNVFESRIESRYVLLPGLTAASEYNDQVDQFIDRTQKMLEGLSGVHGGESRGTSKNREPHSGSRET